MLQPVRVPVSACRRARRAGREHYMTAVVSEALAKMNEAIYDCTGGNGISK